MHRLSRISLSAALALLWPATLTAQTEISVSKVYLGVFRFDAGGATNDILTLSTPNNNPRLRLTNDPDAAASKELFLRVDPASDTARIQSIQQTVAARPLLVNPSGGNVALGTGTYTYPISFGGTAAPVSGYAYDLGAFNSKWLTLFAAELRVETLVAANVMSTIGGRILVAPTTQLTGDVTNVATSMYVKHNNLEVNDFVRLEANGNVEVMKITAGPGGGGPYYYEMQRALDGTGADNWYAGDALVTTGKAAGEGYIDLYSDRSAFSASQYGPTIQGVVRTGTSWNNLSERWALGNLDGLYGYSGTYYGAAFGDPAKSWIKLDDTNGLRLGNGGTTKVQITTAGDASFAGAITSSSGTIGGWTLNSQTLYSGSGATSAGIHSGGTSTVRFWAGSSDLDTAPFRVTQAGALTATSGAIGGWSLGAETLTASSATVGLSSTVTGGDDIRFWAGHASPGSAAFRVTEGGVMVASSATITGTVYASAGYFGDSSNDVTIDSAGISVGSTGTISAAGGDVTLTSGGLSLAAGTGSNNQVKWSDGTFLRSYNDALVLSADSFIQLSTYGGDLSFDNNVLETNTGDLGRTGARWHDLWLEDDVHHFGDYYWDTPPYTDAGDYPIVWSPSIKALYYKNDGIDRSCADGFLPQYVEKGILVGGGSCYEPDESPTALRRELNGLKQEVAELRAQVAALLAHLGGKQ